MPLVLRPAKEEDSLRIGYIGADAFRDTVSRALFPPRMYDKSETGDPRHDEAQWRGLRNAGRMKSGKITHVIVDIPEDGSSGEEIVGMAQWEPPSQGSDAAPDASTETQQDVSPGSLDQEELAKLMKLIDEISIDILGPQGHSNIYYLMVLAVDPAHQRRGVGKMLIRRGLELAAEAGKDAFLIATLEGRGLYQSVGFRDVGKPLDLANTPHYPMLWKYPGSNPS
ncbi:acyl-CoA N-acyltransferase [Chaetomium sp. MPI-SDFR-AT-0129]|nr:acyl-CoA N-acyltransferase [Chaetomium sp. MPI-SDFR-AT-0129]